MRRRVESLVVSPRETGMYGMVWERNVQKSKTMSGQRGLPGKEQRTGSTG